MGLFNYLIGERMMEQQISAMSFHFPLVKAILPLNVSRATSGDRMFAVGSILHFDERADECILVWGSGIRDLPLPNSKGLRNSHLLAVRGPHTWQALRFHGIKMRRILWRSCALSSHVFP